jgi:hypothetical protein
VPVDVGATYVASYFAPAGHYAYSVTFATRREHHHADSPVFAADGWRQRCLGYGAASNFPTQSFRATNYWVDVVFDNDSGGDTSPPQVVSMSPAANATGVDVLATVTATFNEAINPATMNSTNFSLRDGGGATVSATVIYNSPTLTAILDPSAALAYSAHGNQRGVAPVCKPFGPPATDMSGRSRRGPRWWAFRSGRHRRCRASSFAG